MAEMPASYEAEFNRLGLDNVRANIATNVYLGGKKLFAQVWLERELQRRSDEHNSEQSRTARSAKNAAWIAAIAAIIAAICAAVSIVPIIKPSAPDAATHR